MKRLVPIWFAMFLGSCTGVTYIVLRSPAMYANTDAYQKVLQLREQDLTISVAPANYKMGANPEPDGTLQYYSRYHRFGLSKKLIIEVLFASEKNDYKIFPDRIQARAANGQWKNPVSVYITDKDPDGWYPDGSRIFDATLCNLQKFCGFTSERLEFISATSSPGHAVCIALEYDIPLANSEQLSVRLGGIMRDGVPIMVPVQEFVPRHHEFLAV